MKSLLLKKFFGGYQDGQTITYESWINETSKIRARR